MLIDKLYLIIYGWFFAQILKAFNYHKDYNNRQTVNNIISIEEYKRNKGII